MNIIIFIIISSAGVNSLLMPSSPIGVTTSFSASKNEEAIFYNPANFEASDNFNLWCFYNRFYVSMHSFSLALSKKIRPIDFGLAIVNFDYGELEWRPDYPTEDPLINYTANNFSLILSAGTNISSQGRVGLNLKYIYENIYTFSDYALAFDLCFAYSNAKSGISFGVSNFGTKITLNNEEVNLPTKISFGGFYGFNRIVTSLDLHYLVNNAIFEFGFGVGFPLHKILKLYAGLNYRENFYPAFGVTINPGKLGIKYGTAFYPRDLGMINIIGIGFGF